MHERHHGKRGKGERRQRMAKHMENMTPEERAAALERMQARRDESKAKRAEHEAAINAELFALLDGDANGFVSEEEFAAATPEQRRLAGKRAMFKNLDANASGDLTADELPNRIARLKAMDADGDGLVTRQEMRDARDRNDAAS